MPKLETIKRVSTIVIAVSIVITSALQQDAYAAVKHEGLAMAGRVTATTPNTIRSGKGAPSSSLGGDGDFYIDLSTFNFYGPKSNGRWPAPTSLRGPAGTNGIPGAAGTNGAAGSAATASEKSGPIGLQGLTGETGAQGVPGLAGSPGSIGATGPTGPAGPQGIAGPAGSASESGSGSAGATGPQGVQGSAGATGATGPQGDQGLTGLTGATGATGPSGATGPKGDQGLTGQTGTTGLTGATGPSGTTGASGAQGVSGPTGIVGPTGPTGAIGLTGAVGTTGLTGSSGSQGLVGATGAQGLTGPQGLQGTTGATGAAGSSGSIGLTGAQGATGPSQVQVINLPTWNLSSSTVGATSSSVQIGNLAPGKSYAFTFVVSGRLATNQSPNYAIKLGMMVGVSDTMVTPTYSASSGFGYFADASGTYSRASFTIVGTLETSSSTPNTTLYLTAEDAGGTSGSDGLTFTGTGLIQLVGSLL